MYKITYADKTKFNLIFNAELLNYYCPITGFDIVDFDDFIAPPDGISLRDKIMKDYGEEAVKLIEKLIG